MYQRGGVVGIAMVFLGITGSPFYVEVLIVTAVVKLAVSFSPPGISDIHIAPTNERFSALITRGRVTRERERARERQRQRQRERESEMEREGPRDNI